MPNVFAYGTLMYPEVAYPIAQISAEGEPITVQGFRRFEARTRGWGNYPAVQADDSYSVDGLLFRDLSESQLAKLDWFEDVENGLYVREKIYVPMGDDQLEVFLYVGGTGLEKLLLEPLCKAWCPELFRNNELSRYVQEVVLSTVENPGFVGRFGMASE